MAYRLTGTDPFWRASIGAFSGYGIRNNPSSFAALLKRIGTGSWQGIHIIDDGSTNNFYYTSEFNPSNQLQHSISPADGGRTGGASGTFNNTTDWMIVGYTWNGTSTASQFVFRYKIGAGAWTSATATGTTNATTVGAGYRHLIGNEAALGDDGSFDICCAGLIKSTLAQATFESLDMANFSSWEAVFTGAGAALWGFETISSQNDRTGNGANESSRSAGITLVSDPAGWSWGAAAPAAIPSLVMAPPIPT